ncbi:MAG: 50S ribosomal protein L20 [Dehalococcoidales bacterium]|nr:50S ribosomal protein L20 [Dehalococcoidales bacterium]
MPRATRGVASHHRHKKVLALTKGHNTTRHRLIKRAHESMLHALSYAYAHRRERKGDIRRLWIARINAGSRANGMIYSEFMEGLKKAGVIVNRKMLSDMAIREPAAFASLATLAKGAIAKDEAVKA